MNPLPCIVVHSAFGYGALCYTPALRIFVLRANLHLAKRTGDFTELTWKSLWLRCDILCVLHWNTVKSCNKLIFSSTTETWNFALQKGEKYFSSSFPKEIGNSPYFHPPHSLSPLLFWDLRKSRNALSGPSTTNLYGLMTQFHSQK